MTDSKVDDMPAEEIKIEETKDEKKIEEANGGVNVENIKVEDTENVKVEESKDEKKGNHGRGRRYSNGMLKTSAEAHENPRKNVKYDPSLAPKPTEEDKIPAAIRAQVEFYFSDHNLPGDKFLWGKTDGVANKPVSLGTIMSFGRMKIYNHVDTAAALKHSGFLNITGEAGEEKVNRKFAYDPTNIRGKEAEPRTVYVKGFGDEVPTSQFDIEDFFTPYGPVNAVRLRRTQDKLFKGSVWVEFENEELADAFLALEHKPLWKGDNVLLVQPKKEYMAKKEQEIKEGKIQPSEFRSRGRGRGRGDRGGFRGNRDREHRGGGRRDRDPDDWKKRREDDRANGFNDDRRGRGRGRGDRGGRRDDRRRDDDSSKVKKEAPATEETKKRERDVDSTESPSAKKVKPEEIKTE